jgi:hypothetical protein
MFEGVEVVIFHPQYWIFDLGIRLNRYLQTDGEYQWVKKELDLGLLVVGLRFSWTFNKTKREPN